MSKTATTALQIGHSPDPDDAFMWYPLADIDGTGPKVDTGRYHFQHVLEDIESLNHRAERGELEITAISIHQYAYVAGQYALTACGSSMGDGYGPMIIANRPLTLDDLPNIKIAVPGERTTAFLAASLMIAESSGGVLDYDVVMFDQIIPAVVAGKYDAGLIIHEGQLTYADAGLEKIVDLGQWWQRSRHLPLPLGGNAVRRDLASQFGPICRILLNSIHYALDHRAEAVDYAMNYARDMGADLADRFVGMYVNDWTLDYGQIGRLAVKRLLDDGAKAGLIPAVADLDLINPDPE